WRGRRRSRKVPFPPLCPVSAPVRLDGAAAAAGVEPIAPPDPLVAGLDLGIDPGHIADGPAVGTDIVDPVAGPLVGPGVGTLPDPKDLSPDGGGIEVPIAFVPSQARADLGLGKGCPRLSLADRHAHRSPLSELGSDRNGPARAESNMDLL